MNHQHRRQIGQKSYKKPLLPRQEPTVNAKEFIDAGDNEIHNKKRNQKLEIREKKEQKKKDHRRLTLTEPPNAGSHGRKDALSFSLLVASLCIL
ncbi:unnamed protein product [Cochlearia groenlandica]